MTNTNTKKEEMQKDENIKRGTRKHHSKHANMKKKI